MRPVAVTGPAAEGTAVEGAALAMASPVGALGRLCSLSDGPSEKLLMAVKQQRVFRLKRWDVFCGLTLVDFSESYQNVNEDL